MGGSKVLRKSDKDIITVIGAGVTVHEPLKAYEELKKRRNFHSLAVRKKPKSGKLYKLLDYEEISPKAIIKKVKELLRDACGYRFKPWRV